MNTYIPGREPDIRVFGRTDNAQPPALFWTGSGIEFTVDGSELYIDFTTDYAVYEQWVRIEINGFSMIRTTLPKGESSLCIFRNMNPENIRTVRVYKEVQPMESDCAGKLVINAVRSDGNLKPLIDKRYKLEFIGDSITSGEGLAGASDIQEWNSSIFSTREHYAVTVAKRLDADVRILSQSGWGVYSSWDNNPNCALPKYYEQICGILSGENQIALGARKENDFESWQPDAVIINLGTNDNSAFYNKPWTDPATGVEYAQRLNEDGTFEQESINRFTQCVYEFLVKLRRHNHKAHIVWAYGMLGDGMQQYILEAMDRYKKDAGDNKVSYLRLPDLKEEWKGSNSHPGALSHQAAAETLTEYLRGIL